MIKKISSLVVGLAIVLTIAFAGTAKAADKITICHLTKSESNPYVLITVSMNSLQAHFEHGDFIPTEDSPGCTTGGGDPVLE